MTDQLLRLQEDIQAEQAKRFALEAELAELKEKQRQQPQVIAELKAKLKQSRQYAVDLANRPPTVIEKPVERVIYKDRVIEKPVERVVFRDRVKEVPGPERIIIKTEKAPSAKTEKVAPLNAKIKRLTKALDEHKLTLAELREKAAAAQATIDQQQAHINHITDQLRAKNVSSN